MDLTDTIAPRSDQLNADDLVTGPRTLTVEKVSKGSDEQPVDIHLTEFPGRPFKPSKSMRRVLVAAWGKDASSYVGRRMTLYRDDKVKFGGQEVGGIRISHLSDIDKKLTVALTVTRGKRAPFVVQPLNEPPAKTTVPPETNEDQLSSDQSTKIFAQFKEIGIESPDDMKAYISKTIGREIASSKDLTKDEANQVIESQIADLETEQ